MVIRVDLVLDEPLVELVLPESPVPSDARCRQLASLEQPVDRHRVHAEEPRHFLQGHDRRANVGHELVPRPRFALHHLPSQEPTLLRRD
jgi:hypothetical protein